MIKFSKLVKENTFSLSDVYDYTVSLAKRDGNKKRNYLIVNPLQAKHVPVAPSDSMALFQLLTKLVEGRFDHDRLLCIGFAETATAIGQSVASHLSVHYIHTTREELDDNAIYFTEDHSHATQQKLDGSVFSELPKEVDTILFIEDEITTGKTIAHIAEQIDHMYPGRFTFHVLSILNGMSDDDYAKIDKLSFSVEFHYLVKIDNTDYPRRAEAISPNGRTEDFFIDGSDASHSYIPNFFEFMTGFSFRKLHDSSVVDGICEYFCNFVMNSLKKLPFDTSDLKNKRILVLGTEELMYPAIYLGFHLELKGANVFCHSTTRSPIAVSDDDGYPLSSRYKLNSFYDKDRVTYLYDFDRYDMVIVVTDASEGVSGVGESSLLSALESVGNQNICGFRFLCRKV